MAKITANVTGNAAGNIAGNVVVKHRARKLAGGVILWAALLTAGCGGQKEAAALPKAAKEGQTVQEKTVRENTPREVVLWSYYETNKQKEGLNRLVEGFNRSQKEYEARWEYRGPSSEFKKLLSIGVAEGKLPDVVLIDNPDMRKYVELGIFEDITEHVEQEYDLAEFYPEVISSVRYGGRYYGMPFCCNNVGLIYNKDMFREAGIKPPKDWDEFLQAAEIMTADERYGFAMSAIIEEQSSFQLVPWILSTGEQMDELGGSGTVKALELIQELVERGYMSKDCINYSQVDVARKFAAGQCAMMENGPWALPLVEQAGIDFGVVRLPVDQRSIVVTGGENFGVIKGKNVDGSLALLSYCYEDKVMLGLSEQMYSLPPVRGLAVRLQEQHPVYRVFVQQMENCITRSAYSYWPRLTQALSESLYEVITGGMDPEQAARAIGSGWGREN